MGYSPGEFAGYIQCYWDENIHWELCSGRIRLWAGDEMMLLVCLMDEAEARKALDQLQLLIDMAWPKETAGG